MVGFKSKTIGHRKLAFSSWYQLGVNNILVEVAPELEVGLTRLQSPVHDSYVIFRITYSCYSLAYSHRQVGHMVDDLV